MVIINTKQLIPKQIHGFLAKIILKIIQHAVQYTAYQALTFFILINLFYVMFTFINLSGGDLAFLTNQYAKPVVNYIGLYENRSYNTADVLLIYSKISLVFYLVSVLFFKFHQLVTHKKITISARFKFLSNFIFSTILLLLAQVSIFTSRVPINGVGEIRVILLGFWIWGLIMFLVYNFINRIVDFIDMYTTKI